MSMPVCPHGKVGRLVILEHAQEPDASGAYAVQFDFDFNCEHGCTYETVSQARAARWRVEG